MDYNRNNKAQLHTDDPHLCELKSYLSIDMKHMDDLDFIT